jgi:hypothetical protein
MPYHGFATLATITKDVLLAPADLLCLRLYTIGSQSFIPSRFSFHLPYIISYFFVKVSDTYLGKISANAN